MEKCPECQSEVITNEALEMCDECWENVMNACIPGNYKK